MAISNIGIELILLIIGLVLVVSIGYYFYNQQNSQLSNVNKIGSGAGKQVNQLLDQIESQTIISSLDGTLYYGTTDSNGDLDIGSLTVVSSGKVESLIGQIQSGYMYFLITNGNNPTLVESLTLVDGSTVTISGIPYDGTLVGKVLAIIKQKKYTGATYGAPIYVVVGPSANNPSYANGKISGLSANAGYYVVYISSLL